MNFVLGSGIGSPYIILVLERGFRAVDIYWWLCRNSFILVGFLLAIHRLFNFSGFPLSGVRTTSKADLYIYIFLWHVYVVYAFKVPCRLLVLPLDSAL